MTPEFEKRKFSGLDGKTYVSFTQKSSSVEKPFTVLASKSGLTIFGTLEGEVETGSELEKIAEVIGNAWEQVHKLRPKLMSDIPGDFNGKF